MVPQQSGTSAPPSGIRGQGAVADECTPLHDIAWRLQRVRVAWRAPIGGEVLTSSAATPPEAEHRRLVMQTHECEVCGNQYERAFEIVIDGEKHVFDSFECAIDRLAPRCDHCECRIIGHGVEADGAVYCCAHCARHSGVTALVDHA
jgi:hypothetical protein